MKRRLIRVAKLFCHMYESYNKIRVLVRPRVLFPCFFVCSVELLTKSRCLVLHVVVLFLFARTEK